MREKILILFAKKTRWRLIDRKVAKQLLKRPCNLVPLDRKMILCHI
jgi:hypothetical protein